MSLRGASGDEAISVLEDKDCFAALLRNKSSVLRPRLCLERQESGDSVSVRPQALPGDENVSHFYLKAEPQRYGQLAMTRNQICPRIYVTDH
jgi:hypothetical protein